MYRTQGHSFPYDWITKNAIVIYVVLQNLLTNLHMLAQRGLEFCTFSMFLFEGLGGGGVTAKSMDQDENYLNKHFKNWLE